MMRERIEKLQRDLSGMIGLAAKNGDEQVMTILMPICEELGKALAGGAPPATQTTDTTEE